MPVRIVLDHPRQYLWRRLWQRILGLAGAILLVLGIAGAIVAVPANLVAAMWLLDEEVRVEIRNSRTLSADEILLAWAISTPLAIFGVRHGFRLVRGRRGVVVFLRRFGYDDATAAVTFAVTRTIGGSWRLVTLDDAEVAPLGVAAGTRALFRAVQAITGAARRGGEIALRTYPVIPWALCALIGGDLVRARIWEHAGDERVWMRVLTPYMDIVSTTVNGRLPVDAVSLSLPGMFAALAVAVGGAVLALGAVLTAAPLLWLFTVVFLLLASVPAGAVKQAEQLKTRDVHNSADLDSAIRALREGSQKVFGPRLVVLRVSSIIWRQAVSRLTSVSSVALVDVSEPTDNLLWEIKELLSRRIPVVFICRHDRAQEIAAAATSDSTSTFDDDMGRLLDMQQILAYTTDRSGRRRFARALRATLLSLA